MAKKAHKTKEVAKKKRKAANVAPKEAKEGQLLGTVSIPVQVEIAVPNTAAFDELVIEWGCLGLSEEPDSISERSGNSHLLDGKRPITTSEEGMHLFFDPPISVAVGGTIGFCLICTYNDAVEARTAPEENEDDDDLTQEQRTGERQAERTY